MIFYLPIGFLSHPICTIGVALPLHPTHRLVKSAGKIMKERWLAIKIQRFAIDFQIIIIILHRIFSIIAGNVPT